VGLWAEPTDGGASMKVRSPMRYLKIALISSLAINLFLGGIFFTHWLRNGNGPPFDIGKSMVIPPMLMAGRDALDEQGRQILDPILKRHVKELIKNRQGIGFNFEKIKKVLITTPGNKDVVDAAFSGGKNKFKKFQNSMKDMLIDIATHLSMEQRMAFFKALQKPVNFGRGKSLKTSRQFPPFQQ
jgi:hypothetical protein